MIYDRLEDRTEVNASRFFYNKVKSLEYILYVINSKAFWLELRHTYSKSR